MSANGQAVVIGAGIGGLLAARVLAEHFDTVTVVDRDALPDGPTPRRGVPQGSHVHALQMAGTRIVGELFPGLRRELLDAGARAVDNLERLHFRTAGMLICDQSHPVPPVLAVSRPFLEWTVRRQLVALTNIRVIDRSPVTGLRSEPDTRSGRRITGVQLTDIDGGSPRTLDADLVLDTSGRGSRTPIWLSDNGFVAPPEERVVVRIGYASQQIRLPAGTHPRDIVIEGRTPARPVGMAVFAGENNSWTFSVMTTGTPAPADREELLTAGRAIAPDWLAEAIDRSEPLGPVTHHGHPSSLWRHYERLRRFPSGLLVLGDATCALNPVYGLGMTIAARQALLLRDLLTDEQPVRPQRFLAAAARPVADAWWMSNVADLAFPQTQGRRTAGVRYAGRYLRRVLGAAHRDPAAALRFLRVAGQLDRPVALLSPAMLAAARRRPTPGGPAVGRVTVPAGVAEHNTATTEVT
ncbi:FAD-dependent oxidoreductase [Nakamurella lactea]|uniref:FAD-dependent oxidoreductase n=1 Tax=Nakamurella lactea TaxID=459515 RepID=UPI000407D4DB|nr:hypothetical protein [Nakamurella lactea]